MAGNFECTFRISHASDRQDLAGRIEFAADRLWLDNIDAAMMIHKRLEAHNNHSISSSWLLSLLFSFSSRRFIDFPLVVVAFRYFIRSPQIPSFNFNLQSNPIQMISNRKRARRRPELWRTTTVLEMIFESSCSSRPCRNAVSRPAASLSNLADQPVNCNEMKPIVLMRSPERRRWRLPPLALLARQHQLCLNRFRLAKLYLFRLAPDKRNHATIFYLFVVFFFFWIMFCIVSFNLFYFLFFYLKSDTKTKITDPILTAATELMAKSPVATTGTRHQ